MGGRASSRQKDAMVSKGEWNQLTVSAHGQRVTVHVNGQQTASLPKDSGRLSGHLALQLHGGQDMWVEYRDIEILSKP